MILKKIKRRNSIRARIRKIVNGTATSPRLSVFRSNKAIYAQLINDADGITIAACSSAEKELKAVKGTKIQIAHEVGKRLAEKASGAGVKQVVFDRGGYLYHGRIKSLAEGAREGGLKF